MEWFDINKKLPEVGSKIAVAKMHGGEISADSGEVAFETDERLVSEHKQYESEDGQLIFKDNLDVVTSDGRRYCTAGSRFYLINSGAGWDYRDGDGLDNYWWSYGE
jgi:hypothetical protein